MKRLLSVLGLLASVLCAAVAADPTDLAPDLGYLRVHSVVTEHDAIAAALAKPRALVLDLRYPADERDSGDALRQQLAGLPIGARVYVLVSPATPLPIVGAVAAQSTRLITLGVKGARPEPQVGVQQAPDDDRRAYEALAAGASMGDLVSGRLEKERFDEASLVHEFKNGNTDAKPPESGPAKAGDTSAKLTDRVLQRALHLHRALQVLKR